MELISPPLTAKYDVESHFSDVLNISSLSGVRRPGVREIRETLSG